MNITKVVKRIFSGNEKRERSGNRGRAKIDVAENERLVLERPMSQSRIRPSRRHSDYPISHNTVVRKQRTPTMGCMSL